MAPELIAGAAIILVALINGLAARAAARFRRENSAQHGAVYSLVESIDKRTMDMDDKLDKHGEWIAEHNAFHRIYTAEWLISTEGEESLK